MPVFETPDPISATIEAVCGHVWIRASDRADTVVEVRPADESADGDVRLAEQTRVDYDAGRLHVRSPRNTLRSLFGRTPSIEVTVELPAGSRVDAKGTGNFRGEGRLGDCSFDTAAGSIRLDRAGRLKLRSAAGDVRVDRSGGHADVLTSTGKIWLGAVEGTAVARTSNGDITVGEAAGELRLKTANGDITVDRALAAVGATTAFGSVRIGEAVRGAVTLETGFGELEIGIPEGTAAWLDVRSRFGSVRSELETSGAPPEGGETVEVRARTGYGDILVHRP
ncbi:DUF4097 family beta strand repeat-containing protein [Actinomadura rugatobispora]|uniref:DUF4097 domain-containing protein n=1 Tax=Actinomadura rugatobispora TaxID=1994 RepID=A0ABW1A9G7_9ACTN|nr:DUF4097 family beta strand repeat-containing protein [Actinomadura rugatobispora]